MKTLVGKIVSLAAVVSAASLTSSATPPTLDNSVSRDLNRLTLLKGPNLTSPARPISTPSLTPTFVPPAPEVGEFRFVPQSPETGAVRMTGPGRVVFRKTDEPAAPTTPPAATPKKTLPDPDSLRFDSKLHPTPTRGRVERVPEAAPKLD